MTGSSFIGEANQLSQHTHAHPYAPFLLFLLLQSRVVPDFLVQTGDKTGTGAGGESFFGGAYAPLPSHGIFVFLMLSNGWRPREQNSSRMRFIRVYDLRIVGSLRWRIAARRTQMIHNSSSPS